MAMTTSSMSPLMTGKIKGKKSSSKPRPKGKGKKGPYTAKPSRFGKEL